MLTLIFEAAPVSTTEGDAINVIGGNVDAAIAPAVGVTDVTTTEPAATTEDAAAPAVPTKESTAARPSVGKSTSGETPKAKRNSFFGSLFKGHGTSPTAEKKEKEVAPVVPPKDATATTTTTTAESTEAAAPAAPLATETETPATKTEDVVVPATNGPAATSEVSPGNRSGSEVRSLMVTLDVEDRGEGCRARGRQWNGEHRGYHSGRHHQGPSPLVVLQRTGHEEGEEDRGRYFRCGDF